MYKNIIALALGIVLLSSPAIASNHTSMDIVDTAVKAGSFNTLVAAVKAAGLVETLKGDGPFTVFAPTDEAFAKLPPGTVENLLKPENRDQLKALLLYHVVPGNLQAKKVASVFTLHSADKRTIRIKERYPSWVRVAGAKVIKADIMTSNGIIHVIDTVMDPNG
jgi:uncharacterized surface protein with fasciclin (FAS1) repeats